MEKARSTETPIVIFSPDAAGVRKIIGTRPAVAAEGRTFEMETR